MRHFKINGPDETVYKLLASSGDFYWLWPIDVINPTPRTVLKAYTTPVFKVAEKWANVYADGYLGRWEMTRQNADRYASDRSALRVGVIHLFSDGHTEIESV